jgi:hypothetical protein
MTLVSLALGLLDRLREQKGAFERGLKALSSRNVAFEVSSHRSDQPYLAIPHGNIASDDECYANNPIQVRKRRRAIKVDDWHRSSGNWDFGAVGQFNESFSDVSSYGCGVVGHDGSISLFKWDSTKGCMVPFRLSNRIASESASI